MAHELRANTALMDLDLHFGTTTLSLDLETGTGLREALESPHRIDKLFLDSAIVKESERLSVLGTEEPIDEVVFFNDNAVEALIKEVGQDYNQLVIDLPRALLPLQGPLLSAADNVVLVSDQTLAGIRDMNRVAQALNALAIKGQIVKVVSRVGKDRVAQVSRTDFERGINAKIDFVVPEDPKTLTICANAGKPIPEVAKKAPITKILEDIAKAASGKEEPKKKGLFGGFGRKKAAKNSAVDEDEKVDAQ
jgi:pilus assembly protein CpaE